MKKLIALGLAGLMTLSCGLSALAVEPNEDKSANVGAAASGNSETAFWLKVAEDETEEPPVVDVTEIHVSPDGKFAYEVDYKDASTSKFKVTVPLYVAMYAYGKTGTVTAPAEDAYKIANESTASAKKWIDGVREYQKLSESAVALLEPINNENGQPIATDAELMSTGVAFVVGEQTKDEIKSIIGANDFFYINSENKLAGVPAAQALTLDGQEGHFRKNAETHTVDEALGGYTVQDPELVTAGDPTNIDVKVTEMSVTPNGWNLVSSVPSRAKELYMTINGVDLSKAVDSPYQTSGSNWIVGNGPENALQLPITAAIAANMNGYDTTQVLSVAYTVDVYNG